MHVKELSISANELLNDPLYYKGTAFTSEEREEFGLHGLVPYRISTLEEQVARRYADFCSRRTEVGKYIFLSALQNRNETLFYRLVQDYIEEMLPLIYTPTVGDVSLQFSHLYTKSRGVYLSYPLREKMEAIFDEYPRKEIDVIVVTDGERILGLGDLGANSMPIPVGKLALYTLFGGIDPGRCLPVVLDVGTNSDSLLVDPGYLGWRHNRIGEKEYEAFIEKFVQTVQKKYPNSLLQWEDFGKGHAYSLLERYRNRLSSFNDDIQGTAAVVVSAVFSALQTIKQHFNDQRIVIFGAGSAGIGIAQNLSFAMEQEGISMKEAMKKIYLIDRYGLIHENTPSIDNLQKEFARKTEEIKEWKISNPNHISLQEVVHNLHPTILIGVSAQGGAFTKEILKEMAQHVKNPIVFPLSNPTSKSEATAQDIFEASEGRAIIASGSPFGKVSYRGVSYTVSQCNNVYIFPGLGLGVLASGARAISDAMFLKAAYELASHAPAIASPSLKALFPPFKDLREVTKKIAFAVGKQAIKEGFAKEVPDDELMNRIKARMWEPEYFQYKRPSVH